MAITNGRKEATDGDSQLREVTAWVQPESRFPVPQSDGYSVYSALLSVLSDVDEEVGQSVHDSSLGSLHCSGLLGEFGGSDRSHHKTLLPGETYELSLGIVHPDDADVFQALVNALVLQNETIELSHGQLHVERFESENTTHAALLNRANTCDNPTIEMEFRTPTCIEEGGSVTTMFPTRTAVFGSLLGKWDNTAPEELPLNVGRETLVESVIEKPDALSYDTHSVLVNRVNDPGGGTQPIFRQGFSGTCAYTFKNANESVVNAVTALALFAEHSGVGSAVARGCGDVSVKITDS
ncbi:CRISPR system precrRNA processing endoribonuclease RAMP protein Cas6 [Halovenus sp. HT40]|uniref:CRISPR system precrRNA processing endoribonuclease RAMP protein Cas6 n=1 Tax=Halovenus sp. HT40 TaxID=3126691 RepID=UPI00300ECB3A